jgi:hypothetical protein
MFRRTAKIFSLKGIAEMPLAQFHKILCRNCDKPTLLPWSNLVQTVSNRLDPSRDVPQVFFACPRCGSVGQANNLPLIPGASTEEGKTPHADKVPFFVLLECAQGGCQSQIEVLGTASKDMNQHQVRTLCRTWDKFGPEVVCKSLHSPMLPPEVADFAWEER